MINLINKVKQTLSDIMVSKNIGGIMVLWFGLEDGAYHRDVFVCARVCSNFMN